MTDAERDFWSALEHRICREFEGFEDKRLRFLWCDGLKPEVYDLQGERPSIRGLAYCGHSGQEHWRFTLLLGERAKARAGIDWPSLLPAEDVTGWLSPHLDNRSLVMEPPRGEPAEA